MKRLLLGLSVAALLVTSVSCGGDSDEPAAAPTTTRAQASSTTKARKTTRTTKVRPADDCAPREGVASVKPAQLRMVASDGPELRALQYPHPDYAAKLWSQWGQGIVVGGSYVSALGDHCGANGNSFVYALDEGGRLRMLSDVLGLVDHQPGAWGYGKIHAQMVLGPDKAVYATTYWGSRRGLTYAKGYEGDLLLRIDPSTGRVTNLGIPLPGHGIPALAASADDGLLYGLAADGRNEDENAGVFFAYDVDKADVVFRREVGKIAGFRSILVDDEGRAYFSTGERTMHVYDPATGKATPFPAQIPGSWLRAASQPAPDGTVYGITRGPDELFALSPTGKVRDLGPVRGYTASLAIGRDGLLYYVPGAHGDGWKQGTPLIAVDPKTGKDRVVVLLNDTVGEALGLRIGGSYNVVADPSSNRLLIGLNAGPQGVEESFGEVVLVEARL